MLCRIRRANQKVSQYIYTIQINISECANSERPYNFTIYVVYNSLSLHWSIYLKGPIDMIAMTLQGFPATKVLGYNCTQKPRISIILAISIYCMKYLKKKNKQTNKQNKTKQTKTKNKKTNCNTFFFSVKYPSE